MALRSSIVRRAIRSVACCRREISGIPKIENFGLSDDLGTQFLPYLRLFSTASAAASSEKHTSPVDNGLVRVLESEIESVEHKLQEHLKGFIPDGFPVEIEDNPEVKYIYLTWKYQDEIIKVSVHRPPVEGYYDDDMVPVEEVMDPIYIPTIISGGYEYKPTRIEKPTRIDSNENKQESSDRFRILMTASVSKGDAHTLVFQICASRHEISIDDLSVKNENQLIHEGPYVNSLNDNLREALTEYLEIRGINNDLANFLFDYLFTKDNFAYVNSKWFKALKGFFEK